ncbi:RING-H2 finger protein ATL13 [Dichanthelium oligosanthes]|uniref:RING-type E3 ubiquitin transferase n=1 Tax=Dichanthelium oligosanthes TaxID=888268 RepID=A0A1E5W3W3_9POAL|nr:RING-H2 finger protein ATL13 [Dichanthelium oligosanthes]
MSHYTMHATINYAALPPTSPLQLPLPYLPPPPPPPLSLPPLLSPPLPVAVAAAAAASTDAGFQSRISPSVLLIILILAVIFFVSGLLHLLVRFLLRPAPRDAGDAYGGDANATAFQGQLQQLFHLHDAGVDQSFIDALPVFLYGAVVGAGGKDPFDCAVCLCEFADDDRLRLLPKCSHAFHVDCIDTWLLSHSTCPLCRRSLLADFSPCGGGCSPLVFVLESGSEGSVSDRLDAASSARLSFVMEQEEAGQDRKHAAAEAAEKKDEVVVPVKLGKFRSQATAEGAGGSANPGSQDVRRCFSMGTYEYVMDDSSLLRVAVKPPEKKRPATRMPGHRVAMSECDCHSKREGFRGFDAPLKQQQQQQKASKAAVDKRESFSISKIWMRGAPRRKDVSSGAIAAGSCSISRRVSSFRLSSALQRTASDVGVAAAAAVVPKRRADVVSPVTESEYNVSTWDKSASGSVVDWDLESASGGNGHGLSSRADEAPSFARRTLLWIRGHL